LKYYTSILLYLVCSWVYQWRAVTSLTAYLGGATSKNAGLGYVSETLAFALNSVSYSVAYSVSDA